MPEFVDMICNLGSETQKKERLHLPWKSSRFVPVVRGTCTRDWNAFIGVWFDVRLWENGGLEIWFGYSKKDRSSQILFVPWLGHLIANGLRNIERVRRYAVLPSLTYELELQLAVYGQRTILRGFGENYITWYEAQLPVGEHVMPRSEVGSVDGFDGLITQHFTDWFNLAGQEWDTEISVDYRLE